MQTNAVGTQVVAHACAEAGVPMVYCSTDEVYGDAWEEDTTIRPRTEDDPLLPSSPYSAGKAAGEMAVRAAARSMGLRYAITRGCNAFGPGQGGDKLIPIACELLQSGRSVPLHGGGSQIRQWIHVSEFAAMLLSVADGLVEGSVHNGTFNLAGPTSCSVRDLVAVLAKVCERGPDAMEAAPDRPGQDRAYAISGAHLEQALGQRAKRSILSLSELLALLDHYKDHQEAKPAIYSVEAAGGGEKDARI
jgi:dTDP-glucose 4,6-dehydratase